MERVRVRKITCENERRRRSEKERKSQRDKENTWERVRERKSQREKENAWEREIDTERKTKVIKLCFVSVSWLRRNFSFSLVFPRPARNLRQEENKNIVVIESTASPTTITQWQLTWFELIKVARERKIKNGDVIVDGWTKDVSFAGETLSKVSPYFLCLKLRTYFYAMLRWGFFQLFGHARALFQRVRVPLILPSRHPWILWRSWDRTHELKPQDHGSVTLFSHGYVKFD